MRVLVFIFTQLAVFFVWLCVGILTAPKALAFPEMIKNGYPNCGTCHYNNNGGGLINSYGRQISRETLSTGGTEQESEFLWGLVKPPEWLALGGDYRMVESRKSKPTSTQYRFIIMQGDVEAALIYKQFLLDGTAGYEPTGQFVAQTSGFLSRRHYLAYAANDEITVQGGKFLRAFGINTAEHTISTKRGIGFDEDSETYNLQGSWQTTDYNVTISGIFGRPESPELNLESGASALASIVFAETYKVGMSYFYGTRSQGTRNLFGPWGTLGFSPNFYLLSETDFQRAQSSTPGMNPTWGFANYQRLDYEVYKGIHIFGTQEFLQSDFARKKTFNGAYGLGFQVFPRPHLDIQGYWQRYSQQGSLSGFNNWFWLMFHLYL